MTFAIFIWIIAILCGYLLGKSKGQLASGLVWTILFGPIGLLVVAILPNKIRAARELDRDHLLKEQLALQKKQLLELETQRAVSDYLKSNAQRNSD